MNLFFFGTPEFAVYTLKALVESDHEVKLVVTQPDRPRGRGQKLKPSPVKAFALEHEIPVIQPEILLDSEITHAIETIKPDALVIVAYGQKIPRELLEATPFGPINLHGSLLPKYRGAAPMQRAILEGESVTGVTTMLMNEGWDTGDILLQKDTPLYPDDTLETIHDRLATIGAALILETLDRLEAGTIQPTPQDDAFATKAPKIKEEERWIDWSRHAWEIHNLIRALNPLPGALTKRYGRTIRIWQTIWGNQLTKNTIQSSSPGTVLSIEKGKGIWLSTGDTPLLVTEVQEDGGKRLSAMAYLAGHPIELGEVWGV
jgi:methionyl-tRNA formyltransferase